MKKWLTGIRGAVLMGLAWAVAWGPAGVLVGMIVDPDGSMDEMWVAIGAYPGFLCGAVFFAALGIAGGRRRLDELPLSRAGARGAAAGLLVGVLPFAVGEPGPGVPVWQLGAVFVAATTLLSAASAVGSALLSRYAARRRAPALAARTG